MKYCDASYKLSIKFTDFYKKDAGSFHYPFGNPQIKQNILGLSDWYIKKIFYPETPVSDYAYNFFPILELIEENKISRNESGRLGSFNFNTDVAYHFDAIKFANWLKEMYCIPRGVNLISDEVVNINIGENGISSINLKNGRVVFADLFIDCTGFKSILLGSALEEPFISYEDMLPNNRAWATRLPYLNKEKQLEPYTNCTAIENGWVWNIPSWERLGTGYVYSDKYIKPNDALVEFKNYLKSSKMTIPYSDADIDSADYKDIKFRIGIHKRTFVKNVVAIGLSAGFIEPLESNGLFTTHEFLLKLVKTLRRGHISQIDRDGYNMAIRGMFNSFAEFVASHYALSARDDTKYWKDISKKQFKRDIENLRVEPYTGIYDMVQRRMFLDRWDQTSGLHCIATGLNYFTITKEDIQTFEFYEGSNYRDLLEPILKSWANIRELAKEESYNSLTLMKFIEREIYG
jgi:tryptophan halogenase